MNISMKGRNQSTVRPPSFQAYIPERSKKKFIKEGRDIYDSDSEYEMKKEESHLKDLKLEDSNQIPLKKKGRPPKKSEQQNRKTKGNQAEKKPELKFEINHNFDNYYPEYSEDESDSYDEENEDSDESDDEFNAIQKIKQMKINTKKKQQSTMKEEPVVVEASKKRKKKKKRRVLLDIILGAKQHIDSVDPFLKNTYNTVSESRKFVSNIKMIAKRVESGQDIFVQKEESVEMRVTPTILDFIRFCQDSNRKGVFLVCDSVINHFHLYFARNDMGIIGLIDENLLPFTQTDKLPIYDERDFEDSLYNNILFREIVCLDDNHDRSDDFASIIRMEARSKISQLSELLSHGYIILKKDVGVQEPKIKRQLEQRAGVCQLGGQLGSELGGGVGSELGGELGVGNENGEICRNDEQLKLQNLLFDDDADEVDERGFNFFNEGDQKIFRRKQDLFEESEVENEFLF